MVFQKRLSPFRLIAAKDVVEISETIKLTLTSGDRPLGEYRKHT